MRKLIIIAYLFVVAAIFIQFTEYEVMKPTKLSKINYLIINSDINSVVKVSKLDILSYFEKNTDNFNTLSKYMLNNEIVFGTRPVILNKETGIAKIDDGSIKKIANTLLQENLIKGVESENDDESKYVIFHIDDNYGTYDQGIIYMSDKKVIDKGKTEYNYVKYYEDLGNGWFYYLFYYDQIRDGDVFRKKAWDSLPEQERISILHDLNKALVQLKDVVIFDKKTLKANETQLVISVTFNTKQDAFIGPITIYLDPSTKEILGSQVRG